MRDDHALGVVGAALVGAGSLLCWPIGGSEHWLAAGAPLWATPAPTAGCCVQHAERDERDERRSDCRCSEFLSGHLGFSPMWDQPGLPALSY